MADRSKATSSQSTLTALMLRSWWLLLGNGCLAIVLIRMAFQRTQLPSLIDAMFVAVVASLVCARLADIRYFDGCTAEGARATMRHFWRYSVGLLTGSAAGWGAATAAALL
jgi:hypothetical protein